MKNKKPRLFVAFCLPRLSSGVYPKIREYLIDFNLDF